MKVVFIHTDFRIYWPARLRALACFLKSKQISLSIVEIAGAGSPYAFAQKNNENGNWHILFPDRKMEELGKRELKHAVDSILNNLSPDVIISGAIAFPSGALATAWAKRHKKKIVIFDDAKIEDVPRGKIVTFIKRHLYKCVDAMLYPSEDWVGTGLYWQFERKQLFYGIDVVDLDFWSQSIARVQNSQPYFISIGRQIPVKNNIFLLEAYKNYLAQAGYKNAYNLVLVGDGPNRSEIEAYVRNNNLEKFVTIYPFIQQKDLIAIYRNAIALILASIKETWGLVINEAMACGLPVIVSSRCGATKTLVQNGVNGFVFDPYCRESLVNALALFSRLSKEEQEEMGKQSSRLIQKWGLDRFVTGCFDAICYVEKAQSRKISILERIILALWKGRYRPI